MDDLHQKKIISLLDILGSTIVDVFYNHLHDTAILIKEKTGNNLTICYRKAISDYVSSRDTPEFYKKLINSIHYYMRVSTIYSNISFVDFINQYASIFMPEVYMKSITEARKHDTLSLVLRDTIKTFSDKILSDYLILIIDEHQDPTNILLLQDCILTELVNQREKIYDKFISSEHKEKKHKKSGLKLNKIMKTKKTITKLNRLYSQTVEDKNNLKRKNTELQTKYKALVEQTKDLQQMLLNQINMYKMQEAELYKLKNVPKQIVAISTPHVDDYDSIFDVKYND
jgi:hypothetical protein